MTSSKDTTTRGKTRAAFTLVELLVASAIGLILMGFVAIVFSTFGKAVSDAQDTIRMHDQMRSAAWTLRQDLSGITCSVTPWQEPEGDAGYFELIEGPTTDNSAAGGTTDLVADWDDILMFTTRRMSGAFVGQLNSKAIESPFAEVIWFCTPSASSVDGQTVYELRRRELLVRSYLGTAETMPPLFAFDSLGAACDDLSMRPFAGRFLANGLSDLTKRENRFRHTRPIVSGSSVFPFSVDAVDLRTNGTLASGEDIILSNVIAFDVRVLDLQRVPPDYIDLGNSAGTLLGDLPSPIPQAASLTSPPTYCTWSYHYEFNGVDEDKLSSGWRVGADQGTNGSDDDGDGAPDNREELETSPPYGVPLRGIDIRLRCIEPRSKQIRQITVRHAFSS